MAAVFSPAASLQPGLGVSVFRDVLPPALFTRLKEHAITVEASEYEAPDDPAAFTSGSCWCPLYEYEVSQYYCLIT